MRPCCCLVQCPPHQPLRLASFFAEELAACTARVRRGRSTYKKVAQDQERAAAAAPAPGPADEEQQAAGGGEQPPQQAAPPPPPRAPKESAWRVYFRSPVLLPQLGLVCLYCTVLSLGFLMTSYLQWTGLTSAEVRW